ncbi:MAG: hypothetical protein ACRDXX_20570, partial [Stackebrandtia sp.]
MNTSVESSESHRVEEAEDVRDQPWVRGNDYSVVAVPALGDWTPTLSVSILIPAHNHQDKLDL